MNWTEFEFPLLALAIAANLGLVFVVLRYAPKSQSRLMFILLGVEQIVWFMVNFMAVNSGPDQILDRARWTIAVAAPHPVLFYLFIYSFLRKKEVLNYKHVVWSIFGSLAIIILARSPYLFTHVVQSGDQYVPVAGPGMLVFGLFSFSLIVASFAHLISAYRKSSGIERIQWRFIGIGFFMMILLILFFNFLLAVLSENIIFVNFGHIYTLPFVIFTAYAMIRHNLLNVKGIVAEIMVVLINLILLIQLVNSSNINQFIINLVVVVSTLTIGYQLVRSVIKEVEQRKQLEILTDELAHANDQLKLLDKARAEFISIASHQLRTPPATIKWYLAAVLAGDYGRLNPKIKNALEKSQLTNNTLIGLIDDMLNASRIERGKMEFLFEYADVSKLVEEAVMELVPQATMHKLRLEYKKPKVPVPQILADKEKLQQVFNNLVDNAIKYTKSGKVTVELSRTRSDLVIKVMDTGKGLAFAERDVVFEKYGRGKDSQKHASGLGLGLYVSKVIVEHHKGKIRAESPGVNKGTTFIVTLPIKTDLKAETFDLTKNQIP